MGSSDFLLEIQDESPDMGLLNVVELGRQSILLKEFASPKYIYKHHSHFAMFTLQFSYTVTFLYCSHYRRRQKG